MDRPLIKFELLIRIDTLSRATVKNHKPATLVSPWTVLERQSAHCFELATLLVSLLIGAGYDAYVVSGNATREVCNNNQLHVVCPDLIPKPEFLLLKKFELEKLKQVGKGELHSKDENFTSVVLLANPMM
ncbi:hypothetical protein FOCC_FOCC004477 [Frankliniella occidentalis]|nr:hypothetical protein FOCC_FOCC004477 [Frankliniella occidentalis]